MKNKNPNPDHNIWNNNGTWWCHYTIHDSSSTARRVPYDIKKAQARFLEAGLSDFDAERIAMGS